MIAKSVEGVSEKESPAAAGGTDLPGRWHEVTHFAIASSFFREVAATHESTPLDFRVIDLGRPRPAPAGLEASLSRTSNAPAEAVVSSRGTDSPTAQCRRS